MLDIFVCEDNTIQRQAIVQTIQNAVLIEDLDMQLVLDTGDPYVLLEKLKTSQNTGIYFLDIDLGSNINGMKLAQQIRLFDPRGFIIFITAHSELMTGSVGSKKSTASGAGRRK
ncbi:MAG: response regulator [Lachnospiraceae bacterium]|nr:response regulator [Lachnospiraceae bacterium]